jgi:exosortase A
MNKPLTLSWRLAWPILTLLLASVLIVYYSTGASMVAIWWRSETFTHAFLVPPIVLWLIWRQREVLAQLQPEPAPWVLLPMVCVGFVWLLADLAAVNSVAQFAFTALLVLVVPAVLGLRITRAILFPLGFLFFCVPVGEFLMPQLMVWTADFTVAALQMSGIPVYREGQQFIIPSGNWSVVEACSGVRYLVASVMVGTLFAYLNYTSLRRRLAFVGVAFAVPVFANWLRAYGIVMLGHLSGNKLAVGADHLIYGWLFFGIVITLMFVIGARWSEPEAEAPPAPPLAAPRDGMHRLPWVVAAGALLVVALPQVALKVLDAAPGLTNPQLVLSKSLAGDWVALPDGAPWKPVFRNPSTELQRAYTSRGGEVGLSIGFYRNQDYDRKLVSSDNVLVQSNDREWAQVSSGRRDIPVAGGLAVRTARIAPPPGVTTGKAPLVVWQFYWVNDVFTASDTTAKLQIALSRLLGRGDDSAVLVFYSAGDEAAADARLEAFLRDNLPVIRERLRQARHGAAAP